MNNYNQNYNDVTAPNTIKVLLIIHAVTPTIYKVCSTLVTEVTMS